VSQLQIFVLLNALEKFLLESLKVNEMLNILIIILRDFFQSLKNLGLMNKEAWPELVDDADLKCEDLVFLFAKSQNIDNRITNLHEKVHFLKLLFRFDYFSLIRPLDAAQILVHKLD